TGWEIYAEGGSVRKAGEVGAPCGTTIEVRNLFFNTPARRKFMRREQTEMGHVADVVTRQALAFRHIRFRLVHGNRAIIEAHPEESLEARVAAILGRPLIREMRYVDEDGGSDLSLRGLVSQPSQTRSAPSHIYTFINGRYIRDRVVQHAVMEGYRSLLMKGRYPLAVLFIDIDPALVDVNVHPTKQEVRFRDQRLIHDFISSAVRRNLRDSSWLGERRDESSQTAPVDETRNEISGDRGFVPQSMRFQKGETIRESADRYSAPSRGLTGNATPGPDPTVDDDLFKGGDEAQAPGFFSSLQVLGQYHQSYILCQDGDDLVLVDQHAAHERVRFEQLRRQHHSREIERQSLLFPLVVEVDFLEAAQLEEHLQVLADLGFEVEPFGGNSFAVKALPHLLAEGDAEALLRDVVAELGETGKADRIDDAFDEVLMLMACHGSVRANQSLTGVEILALFKSLDGVDFSAQCPHGRPVMVRMGLGDVERLFKRL
ncbi:MAG TPA: DNA mismatch repair endonuclease MutL, partial [Desulfuromonadales bacterium]|nr:DNA mismatch repair endonuclease MutL [Desulfuromonadales bacterium]